MSGGVLRIGLVLLALAGGASLAQAQALAARADEPRAFGYTVGDRVTRQIALDVPAGLTLDEASLPQTGGQGRAIELQRVVLRRSITGVPIELALDYQVMLAPRELRVLEMPPIQLSFRGTPRDQTLRIEAWPVSVAPLTPIEPATREGLGEMRPDLPAPLIDTAPARMRLVAEAAVAALLLAYLGHVYGVVPWLARRQAPFGRAWRVLKALPAQPEAAQRRAAFEQFHAALNASAGEVLFAHGLGPFIAQRPAFAPLRDDLAAFFARSREEFFADARGAADLHWLTELSRRCRDAERGAA